VMIVREIIIIVMCNINGPQIRYIVALPVFNFRANV